MEPGDLIKFEDSLFRLTETSDGSFISEVWTPSGWVPGGNIAELGMFGQEASSEDVERLTGSR